MNYFQRRRVCGSIVTVYFRDHGAGTTRGRVESWTRNLLTLTSVEVEAVDGYVELTSKRMLIPAERVQQVGIEVEA